MQSLWQQIPVSGDIPEGRYQHSSATVDKKIYIFGGQSYGKAFNDLFELDTATMKWRKINAKGEIPGERWGCALVTVGQQLFLLGGQERKGKNFELRVFDIATETWATVPQTGNIPTARLSHVAALVGTKIYVFGGETSREMNDTYAMDTKTMIWESIKTSEQSKDGDPPARKRHSISATGKSIFIFGGWASLNNMKGEYVDDLWELDTEKSSWIKHSRTGPVPPLRGGHATAILKDKLFLFGGNGPTRTDYNDLHYWNIDEKKWNKKTSRQAPPERYDLTANLVGETIFFFGGKIGDNAINQLYTCNVGSIY